MSFYRNNILLLTIFCLSIVFCYAQNTISNRDYEICLENDAVRRYLNEVRYELHDSTIIDNYRKGLKYRGDWPNPVVVDIPQISADSVVIICCDDKTLKDSLLFKVATKSNSAELYNLIPNRTYRYEIKCNDDVLQQGKIHTKGQVRMINVCNTVYNVRDLGGWKTADSMQVRYGKIFRGTELNGTYVATLEGIQLLRELGIEAELDLRANSEKGSNTSAFGFSRYASQGKVASYYFTNDSGQLPSDMTKYTWQYKWRLEFNFVVNNLRQGRSIYEHCVYGKDRTGYFSLLLEGLLGLPYNDLIKEYELTYFWSGLKSKKDSIDKVIDYINTMDGETLRDKFNTYFINCLGVSQSNIDYFRSEMLEAIKPKDIDDSAIRNIECNADSSDDVIIYDLNGLRVFSAINSGLYLVKDKKGQTRKLFIRK